MVYGGRMTTMTATVPSLTSHDRCDRCGPAVAALVQAVKGPLVLTLCGHHADVLAAGLASSGFELRDSREV